MLNCILSCVLLLFCFVKFSENTNIFSSLRFPELTWLRRLVENLTKFLISHRAKVASKSHHSHTFRTPQSGTSIPSFSAEYSLRLEANVPPCISVALEAGGQEGQWSASMRLIGNDEACHASTMYHNVWQSLLSDYLTPPSQPPRPNTKLGQLFVNCWLYSLCWNPVDLTKHSSD